MFHIDTSSLFLIAFFFHLSALTSSSTVECPKAQKFGNGPPSDCEPATDPNNLPASELESWFTEEMFNDLFPKSNIGWGPNKCSPYSYDAFRIAARYFPRFGVPSAMPSANSGDYTNDDLARRDVASFLAHVVQETGENDISLYSQFSDNETAADACFYRGGFFNWFEGGPISSFLPQSSPGYDPEDGKLCQSAGRYCQSSAELDYYYPCATETKEGLFTGCYLGRGAIQISYNFNYGLFQKWLKRQKVDVNLLENPNLILTHRNPPLAVMASLWFYMTPQPPKPAMHDIVTGDWNAGDQNKAAGYYGPIFGPTSLIINNECNGEDKETPGGGGESRRIKAFKWFCKYFGTSAGSDDTLSCKAMTQKFDQMQYPMSWQPDWSSTWKDTDPCQCAPAGYQGMIPYFDPAHYPKHFVDENKVNKEYCEKVIYEKPEIVGLDPSSSPCLNVKS